METARATALVGRLYARDVKPVYYRADCPYRMIRRNKFAQGQWKKKIVVLIVRFIYYLCTHGKYLIVFMLDTINITNFYHKNNGYLLYFQEDNR